MTIPPKLNGIIYLDQRLQWEFKCAYSTSYEVTQDMTVNAASIEDNFSSSGSFDVNLSFYETDEFSTEQETPAFQVGKPINFGSKCKLKASTQKPCDVICGFHTNLKKNI